MSPRILRLCAFTVAAFVVAATPALAAAKNPWRESTPWIIAHQGGEDEFPSNTMYAFKKAYAAGANMLELDIGVTKDNVVVVRHNTTVDSTTNGTGEVDSFTLKQLQKLDAAYWYSPKAPHYQQGRPASDYPFRGIATGKKKPPKGFTRSDFQVATLAAVMKQFPKTPINVEIKGRTTKEDVSEYLTNARVLAKLLKPSHRRDIIVVSFKQAAVDLFHTLVPSFPLAPGIDGAANFLLGGKSPGAGVVALELPVTYVLNGTLLQVSTADLIKKAHEAGYAWHTWFGDDDPDAPVTWQALINNCVDGVMTAQPVKFGRWLKTHQPPATCRAQ